MEANKSGPEDVVFAATITNSGSRFDFWSYSVRQNMFPPMTFQIGINHLVVKQFSL